MSLKKVQKKLIVVADDFTGATDAGVQFSKAGLKVNVVINTQYLRDDLEMSDVLVVDIESRFDSKEVAYQKCYELGKELYDIGNTIVYKKIDSTFRGNIGAEVDGLMDALKVEFTVLAPALPVSGRTTINGEVFVHHVKLANTEFGADPRTPVKHSLISDIIGLQSKRACLGVSRDLLRGNIFALPEMILKERSNGSDIFVFDAREENDLKNIAQLIENMSDHSILIMGSAGLANHLRKTSLKRQEYIGFVFSGSVSEQSRKQIKHTASSKSCSLFFLRAEHLLNDDYNADELIAFVITELEKGVRRFIFTSALAREDVDKVFAMAAEQGISNDGAAEKVALKIGKLAAALIEKFHPTGVLLTGGDTAIKAVRALHATGYTIDQEIIPGISSGFLTGCAVKSMVATKSGGFGTLDAISKTLEFFRV